VTNFLRPVVVSWLCVLVLQSATHGQGSAGASETRNGSRPGPYSISGVVVNAASGAPLAHVDVSIASAGAERNDSETRTNEDGRFAFHGVRAGKYRLAASRRGFVTAAYQQHQGFFSTAIVTGPGLNTSGLRFELMPNAMLSGSVIDDTGDPVPGATVTLYRQNTADGEGAIRVRAKTTDGTGVFEFTSLEAGSYLISVSAKPWYAFHPQNVVRMGADGPTEEELPHSPLDVAYPTTFYADTTDSAMAAPIVLRGGDHPLINVTMHPVPAVQLRMKVPEVPTDLNRTINEAPLRGFTSPVLTQTVFGTSENVPSMMATMNRSNGQSYWEISGLAPGEYTIGVRGENGQERATAQVDLAENRVFDGASEITGTEISGTVAMAFGAKAPADLNVSLAPVNGKGRGRDQPVSNDGTFTVSGVAPDFYELLVFGGGRQLPVLRMKTGGTEIEGARIQIGSEPVTIAATIGDGSATVSGFAKRDGQGVGAAMVVLVPRNPGRNPYLFRRDQSDSDGSFSLYRVVPGRYSLIAIEDGWNLEWAREGALGKYLARGMQVEVRPDTNKIDLAESIEVQAR
jgi:5-hydroxyisourate hydrolase-like protein (transthyretin family)